MKWKKQVMSAVLTGCLAAGMLAPAAMAANPAQKEELPDTMLLHIMEKQVTEQPEYLCTKVTYGELPSDIEDGFYCDYVYNRNDLVVKEFHTGFSWDGTKEIADPDYDDEIRFTYDSNGNLTKEDSIYETYVYQYNTDGELNQVKYVDKEDSDYNFTEDYTYHEDGLLAYVVTTYSSEDMASAPIVTTFQYDEQDRVLSAVSKLENDTTEVRRIDYTYDEDGMLVSSKETIYEMTSTVTAYRYDEQGNLIQEYNSANESVWYDYELESKYKEENPSTVDLLFDDVSPTAWYYIHVQNAYDMNLMEGVGNTTFKPNMSLNRATLVQILYNEAGQPAVTGKTSFTDVKEGQWYYNAILWAEQNNVSAGKGGGKFGPTDLVSREQLATMLHNYESKPEADRTVLEKYPDADQVHDWAVDGVSWAVSKGIISGEQKKDGSVVLNPRNTATRAQAAAVLTKYFLAKK